MGQRYLGLDASTQSLTACLIDLHERQVLHRCSLSYDEALPGYGTERGALRHPDPRVVQAPPLMWAEALDLLFERMARDRVELGAIEAVAGCGQQHGSVYLDGSAGQTLAHLDPSRPLADNLAGIFSRDTSPIWMDSSTTAECREIAAALGGDLSVAQVTGSRACERFTGPQIRRFHKQDPAAYSRTGQIALVSSFLSSILAGRIAPIDHGDGAGMNLMDIRTRAWHGPALAATAPDLLRRLPELAPPWTVIGPVCDYFVRRHGLNPGARAVLWTGDNPSSVIGLGLIQPGRAAVSLGTSDTCFGIMRACRIDPRGEGHLFVAPTGDYMSLICFKNGSLARQRIRDAHGLDWAGFCGALRETPPGNRGRIMLPYFEPEIVPAVLEPSVRRFGLNEHDAAGNCRAVVEAQMISMRLHSAWMGIRPTQILATGGAARNAEILQIMADVHDCPVCRFEGTDSAALGAALRAAHAHRTEMGERPTWDEVVAGFTDPLPDATIRPDPGAVRIYDALVERYAACERGFLAARGGQRLV